MTNKIKRHPEGYNNKEYSWNWENLPFSYLRACFFAFISLFLACGVATSQTGKIAMPCVTGICVGDGLEALKHVKFDVVTHPVLKPGADSVYVPVAGLVPQKLDIDFLATTVKAPRDVLKSLTWYFFKHGFDNEGITRLEKIDAFCGSLAPYLVGSFTSEGGNKTLVTLRVLSKTAGGKPQLLVTEIVRQVANVKSDVQYVEFLKQVKDTYKPFLNGGSESRASVGWTGLQNSETVDLTLRAPRTWNVTAGELNSQELCGGGKKFNLN